MQIGSLHKKSLYTENPRINFAQHRLRELGCMVLSVLLSICVVLLLVVIVLVFLGGFLLGHALGATTALDYLSDLRYFAECKGEWGSEWYFHSDLPPAHQAGEPVAPERSSAGWIVPGAESRFRLRPYQGPKVPGYFELLPILGRVEHEIVKWMSLPNDPAGQLSPVARGQRPRDE